MHHDDGRANQHRPDHRRGRYLELPRTKSHCRGRPLRRTPSAPRQSSARGGTLMRAAMEDVLDRGYTHIITDVFEDTHSPLGTGSSASYR
jgi:hypothetical protein